MSHKHASHNSAYLMVYTSPCEMLNNSSTATFQSCHAHSEARAGCVFVFFNKIMRKGLGHMLKTNDLTFQ